MQRLWKNLIMEFQRSDVPPERNYLGNQLPVIFFKIISTLLTVVCIFQYYSLSNSANGSEAAVILFQLALMVYLLGTYAVIILKLTGEGKFINLLSFIPGYETISTPEGVSSFHMCALVGWIIFSTLRNESLPSDALALLTISPLYFIFAFAETRMQRIYALICVVGSVLIIKNFISGTLSDIVRILMWSLFSATLSFYYQRNQAIVSKQLEKLSDLKELEEKVAEQKNSMRHMIGNVAHDLKTPLASFTSGVELIASVSASLQRQIQRGQVDIQFAISVVKSLDSCVKNINNTNTFMLMTIHRVLDFTKASEGFKLTPKNETLDLIDTLTLPLNCMRNIQEKIAIVLKPIIDPICSHIITDKQWLQENVLCLLSNAVKYSDSGCITIEISLWVNEEESESDESKASSHHSQSHPTTEETKESHANSVIDSPLSSPVVVPTTTHSTPSRNLRKTFSFLEREKDRSYLRVDIEDHGIGMSDEVMAGLFNQFKQAQRLAGGTGLGLYSLSKRIEAIRGKYGVQRRRDGEKGSLFWFAIPYKPDPMMADMIRMEKAMEAQMTYQEIAEACGMDKPDDDGEDEGENGFHCLSGSCVPHDDGSSLALTGDESVLTAMTPPPPRPQSTSLFHLPPLPQPLNLSVSQEEKVTRKPRSGTNDLSIATTTSSCTSPRMQSGRYSYSTPTPSLAHGESSDHTLSTPNTNTLVSSSGSTSSLSPLSILLVDDSPIILKMSKSLLLRQGHRVQVAENGAVAVRKLQDAWEQTGKGYDVVVMDLQMPVMDGLEAIKRWREIEQQGIVVHQHLHHLDVSPCEAAGGSNCSQSGEDVVSGGEDMLPPLMIHQPIIGMSANSDQDTIEIAMQAGFDAFIAKPFTIDIFSETVDNLFQNLSLLSPSTSAGAITAVTTPTHTI